MATSWTCGTILRRWKPLPSEHHDDGTFKADHNYVRLKQQPVPRAAGQVFHNDDELDVGGDDDRNQLLMIYISL